MLKSWLKNNYLVLIILTILVFGVYANSLNHEFLSDDVSTIAQNKDLGTIKFIFARPFVFLRGFFYSVVYWIAGRNPIAFRLFNLFTHLGVCFVFYFLISTTISKKIGLFCSLVFAVHPILVESIVWISGGYYPQYSLFLLLSLAFYAYSKQSKKMFVFSLSFYLLALFSSERTVIFPLIIFVWELSFGRIKENWKKIIPFVFLSALWVIFFISGALKLRVDEMQTSFYQTKQKLNLISLSRTTLILIPTALSSYFELILWPKNLTLYQSEIYFDKTELMIRVAVTLFYFGLIVYSFKRHKALFFWLLFLFISLLPFLTPLAISWIVAERYVYLGSISIILAVALLLENISKLLKDEKLIYLLLPMVMLPLTVRTLTRSLDWRNQDYLWLAAAKTSPSSPQNHNNLGDLYARKGMVDKAIEEFKTATRLQPNYGDAFHNLANIYLQTGQIDLAEANYQKALSFNPNIWQSRQNLGSIYFDKGNYNQAVKEFKLAIKINPQEAGLHYSLGIAYANQNKMTEAENEFRLALQIDPKNQKAQEALSKIISPP